MHLRYFVTICSFLFFLTVAELIAQEADMGGFDSEALEVLEEVLNEDDQETKKKKYVYVECEHPLVTCSTGTSVFDTYCCQAGSTCGVLFGCNGGNVVPGVISCPSGSHQCYDTYGKASSVCCLNGKSECFVDIMGGVGCRDLNIDEGKCKQLGGTMCANNCCSKDQICADPKEGTCLDRNNTITP